MSAKARIAALETELDVLKGVYVERSAAMLDRSAPPFLTPFPD